MFEAIAFLILAALILKNLETIVNAITQFFALVTIAFLLYIAWHACGLFLTIYLIFS